MSEQLFFKTQSGEVAEVFSKPAKETTKQPQNEQKGEIVISYEEEDTEKNAMVILDASGSMGARLDGQSKMTIAKKVVMGFADVNDGDTGLGIRVYGHRIPDSKKRKSCRDSELILPITKGLTQERVWQQIQSIRPKGYTPLGYSLSQVINDFADVPGAKKVILV